MGELRVGVLWVWVTLIVTMAGCQGLNQLKAVHTQTTQEILDAPPMPILTRVTLDPNTQLASFTVTTSATNPVVKYEVVYTTKNANTMVPDDLTQWAMDGYISPSLMTSVAVNPLIDDTDYYIQVRAWDKYGNASNFTKPVKLTYKSFVSYQGQFGDEDTFTNLTGLAVDGTGKVWVGDNNTNTIYRYDPADPTASLTSFIDDTFDPNAIAFDSEGLVWVANGDGKILRFNPANLVGTLTAFEDDVPTHSLSAVYGILVEPSGLVWVSDINGSKIIRFNPSDFSGTFTSFGSEGTGTGEFKYPRGIARDSTGKIWVADNSNNRIVRFDPADFSGSFTSFSGSTGKSFGNPTAIAMDSTGLVWVLRDFASSYYGNAHVWRFDPNNISESYRAFGTYGSAKGQFTEPKGFGFLGTSLFVADHTGHRIQTFSTVSGAGGSVIESVAAE